MNEHYHSTFGAITESMHIFIRAGLNVLGPGKDVTIFEAGFGTGLNALLTCIEASRTNSRILYYSLEKYPVATDLIMQLNYPEFLDNAHDTRDLFQSIHMAPWDVTVSINDRFRLHKIKGDLNDFVAPFSYDLVYFDAFAPGKQPELWRTEIFGRIFNSLLPGGILVTYCVKGDVKRAVKSAGFLIEKLPGPAGKREILRARKESRE
jgi:tRNA U34 5-methylaminomethyl-2-thiouridine-forming methyltransferase MnmC